MDDPKDEAAVDGADDPLDTRLEQIRREVSKKSRERDCPWCGGREWGIGGFRMAINDPAVDFICFLSTSSTPVVFLHCRRCGALSLFGVSTDQTGEKEEKTDA